MQALSDYWNREVQSCAAPPRASYKYFTATLQFVIMGLPTIYNRMTTPRQTIVKTNYNNGCGLTVSFVTAEYTGVGLCIRLLFM